MSDSYRTCVLYIPDIPPIKVDIDRFLALFDAHKEPMLNLANNGSLLPWDGLSIYKEDNYHWDKRSLPVSVEGAASGYQVVMKDAPDFLQEMPEIKDQVEALPFHSIRHINVFEQKRKVRPHNDPMIQPSKGPESYRVLIHNTSARTFYLQTGETKTYLDMPPEHNVFVFNNSRVPHGADPPKGGRKLLLHIEGELDLRRHLKLFKQTIETKPQNVICY